MVRIRKSCGLHLYLFHVRVMTVELVLVHEVKQDEADDFRRGDKEEAVEPGALGVSVAGDDDNVEDGGDDTAHALEAIV